MRGLAEVVGHVCLIREEALSRRRGNGPVQIAGLEGVLKGSNWLDSIGGEAAADRVEPKATFIKCIAVLYPISWRPARGLVGVVAGSSTLSQDLLEGCLV